MFEFMMRSLVVGALASAAAFLFERSLRSAGRGTRHAWTFAMLATTLLPFVPRLTERTSTLPIPQIALPTVEMTTTASAGRVTDPMLIVWAVLSGLVACYYTVAYARLQLARRQWMREVLAGAVVHVSDRFGPAIFGFVAPKIVVPKWIRDADTDEQILIVTHEREHIVAKDHLQLLLIIIATVLLPWNFVLWLQAKRLRFALEADCDQRVLAQAPDKKRYATLLVAVGGRQMGMMLTPALAEHRNGLERRIAMLAKGVVKNRWRAAALLVVGSIVTVIACESRLPVEDAAVEPQRQTVAQMIEDEYPPLLRAAGIGGTASLRVHVTDDGRADKVEITRSAGHEALDQAAIRLAKRAEWAHEGPGRKTDYWTTTSITFNQQQGLLIERQKIPAGMLMPTPKQSGPVKMRISDEPQPTVYTQAPGLENRDEVAKALAREYPPMLRDAGVGGTPVVWVLIDETGKVITTKLKTPSGHPELDAAAQNLALKLRFTPAKNGTQNVPVWIALPFRFATE